MYSLGDIARITKGKLHGDTLKIIRHLIFDSRKISRPEYSLFFAIHTETADGHQYLDELAKVQIAGAVVEQAPLSKELSFIQVDDTVKALQMLAAYHRKQFKLPVTGITGSNGKTTVKEWIYQLCAADLKCVKSPKSYNSQIGVPLSLWQVNSSHELALFEAGISQPGEMTELEKMIKPDIGIFTHLGDAHGAGFNSRAEKLKEKLILFRDSKVIIAHSEDPDLLEELENQNPDLFICGKRPEDQVQVRDIQNKETGTSIRIMYSGQSHELIVPFRDKASINNALLAFTASLYFGVPIETLIPRLMQLQPVDMRLQQIPGINGNQLILDSYNSDIESLRIALDFLNQQKSHNHKTIILSDILQSDAQADTLIDELNSLFTEKNISTFIGIGPVLMSHSTSFEGSQNYFFEDTEHFLNAFPLYTLHNQTILLKGARKFAFEKIAEQLSAKVHQTRLEVNMTRLQQNFKLHRSLIPSGCKIMVMVKAFAYGVGGHQIAKLLEYNKVDYLGVAYLDEAIELRESGVHSPILVLNADFTKTSKMAEYGIAPTVYSFESLAQLIRYRGDAEITVHIEFDTGMHRLGFSEADIDRLIGLLREEPGIHIASVFSHLSAADEPENDAFTIQQFEVFNGIIGRFKVEFGEHIMSHMANSAGIQRFPQFPMDMVRLGIGIYGVNAPENIREQLLPVVSFKSYIAQVKEVAAGEGIGYGRHDASDKKRLIAIVAVGYADGFSRAFSRGKGYFLIRGEKAPIVGNVCMDMTMCDVSNINCSMGDEVLIFGDDPKVEDLAKQVGTIPYELLTSVSDRVSRIFYQE